MACIPPFAGIAAPRRRLLLLASILLSTHCGHQRPDEATTDGSWLDLVPAFGGRQMAIDSIARVGGNYWIADAEGDELVRLDSEGRVVDRWSHLGPASVPVDEPLHLGQVDEGVILVYLGAKKVAITMNEQGQILHAFSLEDSFGFDVTSADRLWVGRPWSGELVATYDSDGRELGGVGALKTFDEAYPESAEAAPVAPALRDPFLFLNLVHIEADDRGGAFLSFRFAPIVQRYDRDGRLAWETRLRGREVEDLEELFLGGHQSREKGNAVRLELYGMAASVITLGAAFDPATEQLYVLLANQAIVPMDGDGHQRPTLLPRFASVEAERHPFLLAIHTLRPGVMLFTNPILATSWNAAAPSDLMNWPSGE
jgi:hypothetical protein